MSHRRTFIMGLVLVLYACAAPAPPTPTPPPHPTATRPAEAPPTAPQPCGDGRCDAAEQAHPNRCPQDCVARTPSPVPIAAATPSPGAAAAPTAYLTFVVNVHDWVHHNQSAAAVQRLAALFARYGVRGDFYFTAPVARAYAEHHPDVVAYLRATGMTISYHVRAPHPLTAGFTGPLEGLTGPDLLQAVQDYETYRLDLTTGGLDRSQSGGYTYVAQVFGRPPVTVAASAGPPWREAARQVYATLGARVVVEEHEAGADPHQPFRFVQGLLVRPVDFSVTRVDLGQGRQNFWWNLLPSPQAETAHPVAQLQAGLADWQAQGYGRPPFVLAHIHDNNFYRRGSVAWGAYYYAIDAHGNKTTPLDPPFDLHASDPSTPRSAAEQAAIWQAYEDLVAYAAAHVQVITSVDLLPLAAAAGQQP